MEEDLPESGSHTALFRRGLTQRGTVGFLLYKTKLEQLACLFCHKPHTSSTPVHFGAGFRPARNAELGIAVELCLPCVTRLQTFNRLRAQFRTPTARCCSVLATVERQTSAAVKPTIAAFGASGLFVWRQRSSGSSVPTRADLELPPLNFVVPTHF